MAETLVEIVHIGVALFMILVVLVQGGNQGGVGAAFGGGGNSSGVFGATGATTILGKMTYAAAGIFMVTSISLTVMQGKGGDVGLKDRLKQGSTTEPSATTQPAAAAPPAATPDTATPPAAANPPAANPPAP